MWSCIFGLLFYLFLIIYLKTEAKTYGTKGIPKQKYRQLTLLFIAFGMFGICYSDYWSYSYWVDYTFKIYQSYSGEGWYQSAHMEPIYAYLAVWFHGNYLLWRLCWFLLEMCGLTYFFKKVGLNNYEAFFVFSLFALQSICEGRVSWGILFYWSSLYCFFKTGEKRYLLFTALSGLSHNSMLALLAIIPLGLIRVSKFLVLIITVITPAAAIILKDALNDLSFFTSLLGTTGYSEFLSYRLNNMVGEEEVTSYWGNSIGEKISATFVRLPLYYLIFKLVYDYLRKRLVFPYHTDRLLSITFFLFLFTCLVLIGHINSASFYQRTFIMLYVPVFYMTYGLNRDYYVKQRDYRACIYILGLSYIIKYVFEIYYYYAGGVVVRLGDGTNITM